MVKRDKKQQGVQYKRLSKDKNLAELIGIILGDGNLYKHARTESLRVICNSKDVSYIKHIADLIKDVFQKVPSLIKRKNENVIVVSLYQCKISKRLGLPEGNKINNNIGIPQWVLFNRCYIYKCLKGLFETDGCFVENKENYTRVIEFKNNCTRLKTDVYNSLIKLGFRPQIGSNYVRLAKKEEVYNFKKLIDFRNY